MAKQQTQKYTFEAIMKELRAKQYHSIYYLMGDEAYYIDKISDFITDNVLADEEKAFNQTIVYGLEANLENVIAAAKSYPMMSEHQVIVIKEAQHIKDLDKLSFYLQQPMPSTILVFCHKNGTIDRRKKIAAEIERNGVLFESKKLRDEQVPIFITDYLSEKSISIEVKASSMLVECVGSDLNRMAGELDKLCILLPAGNRVITPELVEKNIGISKDFNNFELIEALITKDVFKANRICKYFGENAKKNPVQMTLAFLFNFFSNLMMAYYAPEKSEYGIANFLGFKWSGMARDYMRAMKSYSGVKVLQIISDIRYSDARSKGVGCTGSEDGEILRELLFKILH